MAREIPIIDRSDLTSSQKFAISSVIDILQASSAQKIIVIRSLPGMGKSTLLNRIIPVVEALDGLIVEPGPYGYRRTALPQPGVNKHIVCTETIGDRMSDIRDTITPDSVDDIVTIELAGMDEKETREFVSKKIETSKSELTDEELITYSMGIPLLVDQLSISGITSDIAIKIVLGYLRGLSDIATIENIEDKIAPHIMMPIPENIREIIERESFFSNKFSIYDDLQFALKKQQELADRKKIEESPLFVAPESEQIYNAMFESDNGASIDILVPELTRVQLLEIRESLGYYDYRESPRLKMFPNAEFRKVSFWHRDLGRDHFDENELSYLKTYVANYLKVYVRNELGLSPATTQPQTGFFVHAHAHHEETYRIANIGWLMESLLQQKGIAYFVNNLTYGGSYIYDPEQRHVEMLPSLVTIDRY